jgi:hypothetical protein
MSGNYIHEPILITKKPTAPIFRGAEAQSYYERLFKGEVVCGMENRNIRKLVFKFKKELKMPIETLTCDCDYKNKHKAYYFEWALNERIATF